MPPFPFNDGHMPYEILLVILFFLVCSGAGYGKNQLSNICVVTAIITLEVQAQKSIIFSSWQDSQTKMNPRILEEKCKEV